MTTIHRTPILPQRVRSIGGHSFAFLPHRFLREGFFASLAPDQLRLYVLLVLAADRNGLSFYHYDSICSLLEIPLETYIRARNALITKDLIAFDGTRFQVLSLPEQPHFDPLRTLTTDAQLEPTIPPPFADSSVLRSAGATTTNEHVAPVWTPVELQARRISPHLRTFTSPVTSRSIRRGHY